MYAAHGDHPHCVNELLLRGADFTATNENGDTAYTMVVRNNSHLGKCTSKRMTMRIEISSIEKPPVLTPFLFLSLAQAVIENHLLTLLT